jgi:ADP-ribose pyrophosphatase YjhB (NUDIX family)
VVEAAAPRAIREESRLPAEPVALPTVSSVPVITRVLPALWVLIVAAIAVYLVAGTARVGAGFWIGRRMPVRVIWADFLGWLADQGASPLLVTAIAATAFISLVLMAAVLWCAFTLRDAPSSVAPEDAGGNHVEP